MCYQVLKQPQASSDSQSRQSTLYYYTSCLTWCGTAAFEERLARPLGRGLRFARPLGRGLWLTRPIGGGLVSPDLKATDFVSHNLLGEMSVGGWGYIYLFFFSPTAIYDLSDR